MNHEQIVALLLVIADQRIVIEQLKAELDKQTNSNGQHMKEPVP